jgi:hypothetical protein
MTDLMLNWHSADNEHLYIKQLYNKLTMTFVLT